MKQLTRLQEILLEYLKTLLLWETLINPHFMNCLYLRFLSEWFKMIQRDLFCKWDNKNKEILIEKLKGGRVLRPLKFSPLTKALWRRHNWFVSPSPGSLNFAPSWATIIKQTALKLFSLAPSCTIRLCLVLLINCQNRPK